MRLNHFLIVVLVSVLIFSACTTRPSWVLPEEKMTDVLYDVHLAEAEVESNYNLFGNNQDKRQELLNAVFIKHKITEQQFDTSLVWYNAHLETYFKICDEVNNRYTALSDTLSSQINKENLLLAEHNKVNLWKGLKSYELSSANPFHTVATFNIDSINSDKGDNFQLSFNVLGLDGSVHPDIRFCMIAEDTMVIDRSKIENNGSFFKMITPGAIKVKAISGSIYTPGNCPATHIVLYNFKVLHIKQGGAATAPVAQPPLQHEPSQPLKN